MKVFPCSDLHLEFVEQNKRIDVLDHLLPSPTNVDVLIIAGDLFTYDIVNKASIINYLCNKYDDVILVSGNHEYYGGSINDVDLTLNVFNRAYKNFHYLNNTHVFIDDVMFCGATMWFDYNKENKNYEHLLNDFNLINCEKDKFYKLNESTIGYFINLYNCGLDECVVITHHAPHENSLNCNRFKKGVSNINQFYYSRSGMELIEEWQPKYWIHGHTHYPVDYYVGKTNVISNPSGYSWKNTTLNKNKIIEVY